MSRADWPWNERFCAHNWTAGRGSASQRTCRKGRPVTHLHSISLVCPLLVLCARALWQTALPPLGGVLPHRCDLPSSPRWLEAFVRAITDHFEWVLTFEKHSSDPESEQQQQQQQMNPFHGPPKKRPSSTSSITSVTSATSPSQGFGDAALAPSPFLSKKDAVGRRSYVRRQTLFSPSLDLSHDLSHDLSTSLS